MRALDVAALALCYMGTAVNAISLNVKAIEPTAAGQLGVNLVEPIPSANALIGKIGKNTEYLTDIGGTTTSWKGPDKSFITKTTATVTNTVGAVAAITKEASVIVTQDTNDNFSILLGPALRAKLIEVAKTIPACGAIKRAASCGYTAFTEAVAQFGPIGEIAEIENAMPAGRLVIPANDIAQLIALFRTGAAASVSPAAAVGGGTLGLLYLLYDQWNSNKEIPPAIDVPNSVAGTTKTSASSSSTSAACPGPTDQPNCPDDNCKGDDNKKCTVGEQKDCKCTGIDVDISTDFATEWNNIRSVVEQITLSTESRPVPICTESNKVGLETKLWKAIVTNVCASKPLSADIDAIMTAKDVGFPGYDGWTFAVTWRYHQGDCVFGCEEMFNGFLDSTQCSSDSHTFSGSGNNTEGCGTASFIVNQPIVAPKPTHTPDPPTPVGPALGVPTCGGGLSFQQSDAADSANKFCEQLAKDKSWAKGPQDIRFPKVKIYNKDGTVNPDQQFVLVVSPNAAWCPKDLTLDMLANTMKVDRCVANIMIGVDGCAPFVAPKNGKFLKTSGISYEDCIQWQELKRNPLTTKASGVRSWLPLSLMGANFGSRQGGELGCLRKVKEVSSKGPKSA
ncbi:uncharacterized protein BP5553_07152 [Venustampulla echinocandica]|uniref:Uncharacterized protein n=1 Tax=Venustampulla echinocandica TaxID=2656787 RepID=A0A370TIN6_9HELO|nr:uncharacterized protein BP5553_07152 [Venustampulla echinocandica]RDL35221.1 hypothetical protein BP5553_07152 [Venustampulla echinocandica]